MFKEYYLRIRELVLSEICVPEPVYARASTINSAAKMVHTFNQEEDSHERPITALADAEALIDDL